MIILETLSFTICSPISWVVHLTCIRHHGWIVPMFWHFSSFAGLYLFLLFLLHTLALFIVLGTLWSRKFFLTRRHAVFWKKRIKVKLNEDRKGIERQTLHLDCYKGLVNINIYHLSLRWFSLLKNKTSKIQRFNSVTDKNGGNSC